jgi:uncharacterized protein (TIGR02147 family)
MKKKKAPAPPDDYVRENLGKAEQALDALPKEKRDISAVTVSLSEEAAAMVRWELKDLRRRILEMAKGDERPDQVYQCNLQFFPVSE